MLRTLKALLPAFAALLLLIGAPQAQDAALLKKGEYLARAGDCIACHTAREGKTFAGGLPMKTPFGTLYTSNITPDPQTGIGNWSEDDIVGVLTDGHTPDFDFVGGAMNEIVKNTARLTAEDRRAIAVYLLSIPAKPFAESK